ncbi:condensation domain-containing protein, partial [Pseudoalteromonas luteoviolacea]
MNELLEQLYSIGVKLKLDDAENLKIIGKKERLTPEIINAIKTNKGRIVEWLKEQSNQPAATKIEANHLSGLCSPSFAQQRLWFIDQLQGGTPEYNMPNVFEVQGKLDLALVTEVFTQIIARHEVLRTVYQEVQGEAKQRIRPMTEVDFGINEIDFSHLQHEAQSEAVNEFVESDILQPFNLAEDLMLRVSYILTGADTGVLIFNMHHIASDGWSMEVLTKEFFALYEALIQGLPNPLPDLEIQYADYAYWQHTKLEGEALDKQLDYWVEHLDAVPPVHSLPLSYTRPEVKSHIGAVVQGDLPASIGKKLLALAKQHQLTPFMLLHGALSLLLARHSNNADIVIGTSTANRAQEELAPLIGFFVNTLVLRTQTDQGSLSEYFEHIKQVHLGAQSNQDVPFEQLVERLKIPRSSAHTPLFQIVLTTSTDYGIDSDSSLDSMALSGVTLVPYQADMVQAKFDLHISMNMSSAGVGITWKYDTSLFNDASIQKLNEHLCQLLVALSEVKHSEIPPSSLPVLSQTEEHYLLSELNDTKVSYPKDKAVHELF